MMNRLALAFLLSITTITCSMAQDLRRPAQLELITGKHEVPVVANKMLTENHLSDWPVVNGSRYGVLSLERIPGRAERASLKAQGIEILDHLPKRFYVVAIQSSASLGAVNEWGVLQAAPYLPDFKWAMKKTSVPPHAEGVDQKVKLAVTAFANISLDQLQSELNRVEGVSVTEQNTTFDYLTLEVDRDQMEAVAATPSVYTIEWVYPDGEPENYSSRTLSRMRYLSPDNTNGLGYDGSGVAVAVQDDGKIGPHLDFHGRIKEQFATDDTGDHGDHVTGTVGGAGNLDPWHQGQAEGADLYIYRAWPEYNAISNIDSHYFNFDIYLTSTSYSDGCNSYSSRSRTIDQQSYNYGRLIHVFSAGNAGANDCGYGAGAGWGNITGGHKMGKAAITVGNLTETYGLAGSSSRGPAYDGRIKPDICAKGTSVTSTVAGNGYDTYTGTSMSCPSVAGSLAVLYEAFEDVHGEAPEGGLMKAIVLNTASDLGNPGPDFKHGWGHLNGRQAFKVIQSATFLTDSIAGAASTNTHQITVPSGAKRLRVMLYWTDPAAAVNAATALINDLNLRGLSPNQDTLLPYVLDPTPNTSTLDDPAVTGVDSLNNMEQIEVLNPSSGTYQFDVSGYYVPMGMQEYFLVYYIEEDPLVLTYPVGGESFTPGTNEVIRWDSELTGTVDVQSSTDGGSTWNNVISGLDVTQEFYQWTVPSLAEGDVRIRLVHDSLTVSSDNFSVLETPGTVTVTNACPDSIRLVWNPVAGATSYDIYKLGDKYMDSIGTSTTPEFFDYTTNPYASDVWYAVSADGPESAKSKRSRATEKTPGLINCFIGDDLSAITVTPAISLLSECHGSELNVGFVVENLGLTATEPFLATLYGPSGTVLSDSFNTVLQPQTADSFSFSSPLSVDSGLNEYTLILEMEGDLNHWNDSASIWYRYDPREAIPPLWEENFDQYEVLCSTISNCELTSCELPDGWMNEQNNAADDIDWRLDEGTTPTPYTGPLGDNTTPGGQGKYIYLEASGECNNRQANLVSPCIDLSGATAPLLRFYYHMYGSDIGELHVDVYDGTEWTLDVMEPLSGAQSTSWLSTEVDLSAFNGSSINIRFRGTIGDGELGDLALDDISVIHLPVANFEYFPQSNNQTVYFNDLSSYADSMSFTLGDGTGVLDSVPATHDYFFLQSYSVTQFVSNDFGADSLTLVIDNLGTEELREAGLKIYPIPATTQMIISSESGDALNSIELWSVDGRLVLQESNVVESRTVLDVRSLSAGIYVLKIASEHAVEVPIVIGR